MMKQVKLLFSLLLISSFARSQETCKTSISFTPTVENKKINWQQFPDFTLPFQLVYSGPHFQESQPQALKHGFSHIISNDFNVPKSQRAIIYYGTAYAIANQPWERLRSPWGNDLNLYNSKWRNDHKQFVNSQNSSGKSIIDVDWFVFDIERQIKSNDSILLLRNEPSTPATVKSLDNQSFVLSYKKELQLLYNLPVTVFKNEGLLSPKITSYGDSPVLNSFTNIQANTWEAWKTNASLLNANVYDFSKNTVGSDFYNSQTILMPSAYYYFDYPSPFAPEYLSYLLFQIEVNKAWSSKPIYPFVWLKYSQNTALRNKFIKPWMAEATAIFPFFSGASGLWLWEDPTTFNDNLNYSAYEYFIHGLYRLSQFSDFFKGNYELIIQKSAHEYNKTREPIWRGVVKGSNILIAAHNPNAKSETEEVVVPVSYKNWVRLITLKGYEVFLCSFDMNVLGVENEGVASNLEVFPNPVSDDFVTIQYNATIKSETKYVFYDGAGKNLKEGYLQTTSGQNKQEIKLPKCNCPLLYLSLEFGNSKSETLKIVLN